MRIDRGTRNWPAQASQLGTVLCWLAECELATLARYERLASMPEGQRERHRMICQKMVHHLAELGVIPVNGPMGPFPRLRRRVMAERERQGFKELSDD